MKFCFLFLACLMTRLQAAEPCNAYGTVDFFYWKPHVDGIEYIATGVDTLERGDIQEVDWGFKPGFRVGFGTFICDCWDLSLLYTWYRGHAGDSYVNAGEPNIAVWNGSGNGDVAAADAEWTLHYHTLDFILRREFFLAKCVAFTPFLGVRGAYTKELYDINYFDPDEFITNKQRIGAVGPRIGFATGWHFAPNWSLIGEGAFSILWANYRVSRFETGSAEINTVHEFRTQLFVPEYRVGICWENLLQSRFPVSLCLAWEQQIWINQNQMLFGPAIFDQLILNRNTNLSLYGFSLRATFGF